MIFLLLACLTASADDFPGVPQDPIPPGTVNLAWDASPSFGVTGYRVYQAKSPFSTSPRTIGYDAGENFSTTISNLYGLNYFVATAICCTGLESDFSNEVLWQSRLTNSLQWLDSTNASLAAPMTLGSKQGQNGLTTTADEQGAAIFVLSVPLPGQYALWSRTLGSDQGSDSFYVSVDGQQDIFDLSTNGYGKWTWTPLNGRTNAFGPRFLDLAEGTHSIIFRGREAGAWLAGFWLVNSTNWTPYIPTSNVVSVGVRVLMADNPDGPYSVLTNLPALTLTNPIGSAFFRAQMTITSTNL